MLKEISAEELEKACRKCTRVEVSNTGALARVLDKLGQEYSVISANQADIYAKINITKLTLALAEEGCELISVAERDESLESYYVSLLGQARGAAE